jgi:hypothetical protein
MYNKVHCHVCPLKSRCGWSRNDESWRYQKHLLGRYHYDDDEKRHKDMEAMTLATQNCPLRKVVETTMK